MARYSRTLTIATEKAIELLNDPKVKLVRYRAELIMALLKEEALRRELKEAERHRRHEKEMAKLKSDKPAMSIEQVLEAARQKLAAQRGNNGSASR